MRKVKIALIGCGAVTIKAHLPALMNDPTAKLSGHLFQITAICGLNEANLTYIKTLLPSVEVYHDYKDLLKNADCEAVLIATGEELHPQISKIALLYKKFVLCEKPLGINVDTINKYFDDIDSSLKKKLQIAFNKRFYPGFLHFNNLRKNNSLGTPVCGSFYFITQRGRKKGWEGLLSNMIHYCDLISATIGEVAEISAFNKANEHGNSITATMKTKSGAVVSFLFTSSASWNATIHEEWQIIDENRNRLIVRNCDEAIFFPFNSNAQYQESSNSIFWLPDTSGYKTQLRSFYKLVCGIKNFPDASIEDAIIAHSLFEKIKNLCE